MGLENHPDLSIMQMGLMQFFKTLASLSNQVEQLPRVQHGSGSLSARKLDVGLANPVRYSVCHQGYAPAYIDRASHANLALSSHMLTTMRRGLKQPWGMDIYYYPKTSSTII